jgi:hypothetical protein
VEGLGLMTNGAYHVIRFRISLAINVILGFVFYYHVSLVLLSHYHYVSPSKTSHGANN